ncbi:MAG: hypothetical protein CV087_03085 [Candidatus Brocadia sp. WS118]|nr:MAG: hypothetical protein CV087_03085 [Candidatus Brocadia sp. WS118]
MMLLIRILSLLPYHKKFLLKLNKYLELTTPCLLLSAISGIVFFNTLNNAFVYDDSVTVVTNSLIKSWKNIHFIFSSHYFILSGELSYRPVVTVSYVIDYFLWGLNPKGFHLTNVFLQSANVVLFYLFLKHVVRVNTFSFIAALLFATHPVLTETVNSISYREDLLAALFFLISFILFLKADKKPLSPGKFLLYYTGSLFSYLLSLFSKEMSVTLPILLVLHNLFCFSSTITRQAFAKRMKGIYLGYLVITGFYLFIRFALFRHIYIRLDQYHDNIFVMVKVLASYLKILFFPCDLNADYVVPPATNGNISLIISALLIVTAVVLITQLCRYDKRCWFFASWFFITLLPVSNIIPLGNIMAERYLYIPLMGFSGVVGIIVQNYRVKNKLVTIGFGAIIVMAGIMSIHRNGIWLEDFTLWHSTINREPESARAHINLGVSYSKKGFYDYAESEYKKTMEINPRDVDAHYNMGNAYERNGKSEAAIEEYLEVLRYNPGHADAYNNIGGIYKNRYLFDRAINSYKKAIQRNPFNPNYYDNLGLVYYENRHYSEAVAEFKKALKINSVIPFIHNNLGNTYKETGDFKRALAEYKTAIELDPAFADAHNNLGIVHMRMERYEDAMVEFETALRLNPKLANAHNNLGIAHAQKGNYVRALDELNKAVALGFDNADVHNNLAGVHLTRGSTDRAIRELKRALQYNSKDSNAHCNLGNAYISKGMENEGISELKEAIKYNPTDGEIYYYLGNALYRKGDYEAAADAFHQSIHYQTNNPLSHKMLGIIYGEHLHNSTRALYHVNETLRLNSQQPVRKEIEEFKNGMEK